MADDDDILYWQDALEVVINKRPDKMPKCPFCYVGEIKITRMERKTRLECVSCRHFVEGRFGDDADNYPAE